ncbi:MAG: chromosomal replication initiator protein DnaA [Prevotella sp.]|nr:chromosomal replication initiator protein DnaA [Prevotella sp.]
MKASPDTRWDEALSLISEKVSPEAYNTWFAPLVFDAYDENTKTLSLQVPNMFVYEYLEGNYVDLLTQALHQTFGRGIKLRYRVAEKKSKEPPKDDQPKEEELDSQLNPKQTFRTFIEGDSNKLPRAIGLNIAEHPNSTKFNPMFIYGPSGCGKTHLINAIGNRAKELYPKKRILYISARLFTLQFSNARLQNKPNDFINFYQTIDMLIVDDVQEWLTAVKTQDTFFHIFNHLFRNGKRIILASDRPPVELKGMSERLLTRFSCGLIAELEKPNLQLCKDILDSIIHREGLNIDDDVVDFIAKTANGSVRDLQGVIASLQSYSIVYNCNIDMQLAERVLKRSVKVDNRPLTTDDILDIVCRHYGVSLTDVKGRSRKREFVTARQVAIYLAQKHTKMPASRIGKLIGGRDHSTVIHSCEQVENRLKTEKSFGDELASIERAFKLKKA